MNFRKGTFADGLSILADLREEQCKTLKKLEVDPVLLLKRAVEQGSSMTVLVDERPAAMYGVLSETLLGLPKIWVITTALIEREPIAFLRNSRRILREYYEAYGTLIGMVDAEFERSCAWLNWCGFVTVKRGEFIVMRYSGGH